MMDKTLAKVQSVLDQHFSSSYSGKSQLAAQATEGQVGGRPTFDQNSGSRNTLGSPGQIAGGRMYIRGPAIQKQLICHTIKFVQLTFKWDI